MSCVFCRVGISSIYVVVLTMAQVAVVMTWQFVDSILMALCNSLGKLIHSQWLWMRWLWQVCRALV